MHDRKHNLNAGAARHRATNPPPEPHDRRHGEGAALAAPDHDGGRDVSLSARSLAARGEAPDGSEDGAASRGEADGA
jgi:hypothetical protein